MEEYFMNSRALQNGALSCEDIKKIQEGLWDLLGQQAQSFTMGDSSSVPVETAEKLFTSICFSISLHLEYAGSTAALQNENMHELLRASWKTLERLTGEGRDLLNLAEIGAPKIENRSLCDTLAGIGGFFKRYDYRFFAHEIPADIDYQLCRPVPDSLCGIAYINEYLRRLIIENEFCGRFDTETVILLLKSYCPDYKGLLINIYEPVAVNAVGRAMLKKDVRALGIPERGRAELLKLFAALNKGEAEAALCRAADSVCAELRINNEAERGYLLKTALDACPRIMAAVSAGGLDHVFLSV